MKNTNFCVFSGLVLLAALCSVAFLGCDSDAGEPEMGFLGKGWHLPYPGDGAEPKVNPLAGAGLEKVAFGDGRFVAISGGYDKSGVIAYSKDDGETWEKTVIEGCKDKGLGNMITDIAFGDGVFIAVSTVPGYAIMRSIDGGETWTAVTNLGGVGNSLYSVAYGGGVFIVGNIGGSIVRSTDGGETWGGLKSVSTKSIHAIAYGEDGTFAVVTTSSTSAYSTDYGVTWRSIDTGGMFGVTCYAVGYCGDGIFYTEGAQKRDGIWYTNRLQFKIGSGSWEKISEDMGNETTNPFSIRGIVSVEGRLVSVGNSGANNDNGMAYSADKGKTWTYIDPGFGGKFALRGIAYGNGKLVAVGTEGRIVVTN